MLIGKTHYELHIEWVNELIIQRKCNDTIYFIIIYLLNITSLLTKYRIIWRIESYMSQYKI